MLGGPLEGRGGALFGQTRANSAGSACGRRVRARFLLDGPRPGRRRTPLPVMLSLQSRPLAKQFSMSRKTEVTRLRPLRATAQRGRMAGASPILPAAYRLCRSLQHVRLDLYPHRRACPTSPIISSSTRMACCSTRSATHALAEGRSRRQGRSIKGMPEYGLHAAGLRHPRPRSIPRAGRCGVGDAHP